MVVGLEAGRWLLQQPGLKIHKTKRAGWLSALHDCSHARDAERHVFTDRPVHSWSSHSADGFRYMSTVVRIALRWSRPEEKDEEVSTVGYAKMLLAAKRLTWR